MTEPNGRRSILVPLDLHGVNRSTLETLGIHFDSYFNEKSLYDEGKLDEAIDDLKTEGLVYEAEGAVWLREHVLVRLAEFALQLLSALVEDAVAIAKCTEFLFRDRSP